MISPEVARLSPASGGRGLGGLGLLPAQCGAQANEKTGPFRHAITTSARSDLAKMGLPFPTSPIAMRSHIAVDEKLMTEALKVTGARTKREAVELGLKTLLQLNRQAAIRQLRGAVQWTGDLEAMRTDAPK